ncbi:Predicted acetyltransferase [Paenibacillus sp. 1_12]|uniref:GNAT family N-acetyltransferase n=1 Tax=Paenibacillus sp. 1_12 TaxID=1566278 RepID=UPI0008E469DC|nr:GNAT family N-acetyltransferase [Paenibacillus sp. 1_12]SFL34594.1 Predicted acetyltransferase [Paenibacillus sp. 1_12]
MEIELCRLKEKEIPILTNLFEFAAYDLSEFNYSNVKRSGLFEPKINVQDLYHDECYNLYGIKIENQIAGFVIVRYLEEENVFYLNHFFILRKYRNQGLGQRVAFQIFNMFHGNWRVSQFDWNVPALLFWRKVLDRYTNGNYIETRRKDDKGPKQEFSNDRLDNTKLEQ